MQTINEVKLNNNYSTDYIIQFLSTLASVWYVSGGFQKCSLPVELLDRTTFVKFFNEPFCFETTEVIVSHIKYISAAISYNHNKCQVAVAFLLLFMCVVNWETNKQLYFILAVYKDTFEKCWVLYCQSIYSFLGFVFVDNLSWKGYVNRTSKCGLM